MYARVNWVNFERFTHTVCLILVNELASTSLTILMTLNSFMVRTVHVHLGCPTYFLGVPRTFFRVMYFLKCLKITLNVPHTSWVSHVHLGCTTYIFESNVLLEMPEYYFECPTYIFGCPSYISGCPTYILGVPTHF